MDTHTGRTIKRFPHLLPQYFLHVEIFLGESIIMGEYYRDIMGIY